MKQLASSDYVVGSANAVTEDGSLLFGSMSGSQLGPYVSQASKVILIVGAQKIVKDVAAGLRRLREYALPLESERVRIASGITDTKLNSILILSGSATPDRHPRPAGRRVLSAAMTACFGSTAVNAVAHAVHRVVVPVVVGLGGLLVWTLILVVAVPLGALVALVGWTADQVWEGS